MGEDISCFKCQAIVITDVRQNIRTMWVDSEGGVGDGRWKQILFIRRIGQFSLTKTYGSPWLLQFSGFQEYHAWEFAEESKAKIYAEQFLTDFKKSICDES